MLTPKSDRSSDGNYPYARDFKSDLFESAKFGASQPTLTRNSTPFHMNVTALSTTVTPHVRLLLDGQLPASYGSLVVALV